MNEVVLLEHPKSGYVVRSRPAILSCKALNARRIKFKCNNRWLDENRHNYESGIDSDSNQPFLKAQVEITRQEVETNAGLGDFSCRCHAIAGSADQEKRSEAANVKVAY
uniref:Uncharacterized protein n=1 Tax=Panagrolaimus sp. JU765 TaxID=591449 RepID=A0AC34R6B0_9BILA